MRHALATMRSILYNCSIKLCMNFKLKRNCLWWVCVCVFSVRPPQPARCVHRGTVLCSVFLAGENKPHRKNTLGSTWKWNPEGNPRPQWRRCSGLWGQKVKRKSIKAAAADYLHFWRNYQHMRQDWRKHRLCVVLSCQSSATHIFYLMKSQPKFLPKHSNLLDQNKNATCYHSNT